MKLKLLAVALIAAVALVVNGGFIWHRIDITTLEDMPGVTAGYSQVQSWHDLAAYFFSSWIHVDYEGFRPLSSLLYYFQCWLGYSFGWVWASWVACLLFMASCCLVAGLSWRYTRNYPLSLVAGCAFAGVKFLLPTLHAPTPWLSWWVVSDNLLCLCFFLGALIAFDVWRETADKRYLKATYGLVVASILSKEFALILPALLLVLSLLPATVARRRALVHSFALCTISALLFAYRWMILMQPHKPATSRAQALQDAISPWLPPSPMELFIMQPERAAVYLCGYAVAGYGLWLLWQNRERFPASSPVWKIAALYACWLLCFVPVLGFNLSGHYGLWAMALKIVLITVTVNTVWQWLSSYQYRIKLYRLAISPAVNARS